MGEGGGLNGKEGGLYGKEGGLKGKEKREEGAEKREGKRREENGEGGRNDDEEKGGSLFENGEDPLKCLSSYVLNVDRNLLGFLPLNKFFEENKKAFFICLHPDQYDLKIRLIGYLMERIGCKEEEERKEAVDVNNLMPDLKEVMPS